MLTASAVALAGTPQSPTMGLLRNTPAWIAPPPLVSRTRQGETRKNAAGAAGTTVMVAVLLLTSPHASLTRTQYDVVAPGVTVTDDAVAPPIGLDVSPALPMNHWNPSDVPVAATER